MSNSQPSQSCLASMHPSAQEDVEASAWEHFLYFGQFEPERPFRFVCDIDWSKFAGFTLRLRRHELPRLSPEP
eukprot:363351-Chlamydomonas_euryale.AAC.4